ncbi:hypothetical protein [Myceligenerans crystallogenes]|uniref:Aminoglycoside phosphotransferase n=1 Tax=Myceligenerans crystallogenes TaxID=316335 RepID=A0ABN2ND37_9MICO
MNPTDATAVLPDLLATASLPDRYARRPIRVWARSGVERLVFDGGMSVVFKYAEYPFDNEDHVLVEAAGAGLPVPAVHASAHRDGLLAMLIEDLGDARRQADLDDGARAAVELHAVPTLPGLSRLGRTELAALPTSAAGILGRFDLPDDVRAGLDSLVAAADARAEGAELAPFGLVHSEFHHTSLHVTDEGVRVLDLARAFVGPGLLDLASWHGTIDAPDVERVRELIDLYRGQGGAPSAAEDRGGLDAASWALGWHRVWAAEWFAQQLDLGWADGAEDAWLTAISRHLIEAAGLLKV